MHVFRTLSLIILLLSTSLPLFAAAKVTVLDGEILLRDERERLSYRVPLPPGATLPPVKIEQIFKLAHEPFKYDFTGTQTFVPADMPAPDIVYHFSYFAYRDYRVLGDGTYSSMAEAQKAMGLNERPPETLSPEERAERIDQINKLRDSVRTVTDPDEILAHLHRSAEKRWNSPDIMDIKLNGGDEFLVFLKDAAVTTKWASLPEVGEGTLATRLEFHIDSEQLPPGRQSIDVSENALYFMHGPRALKIGAMDLISRGEEELFAILCQWRDAIIQANPTL